MVYGRRFPVLAFGMRVNLDKALVVIMATAVVHNMLCRRGEQLPLYDPELQLPAPWDEILGLGQIPNLEVTQQYSGNLARTTLVANYFQSLL